MDYQKKEFIGGKWADKEELFEKRVNKAKIVSETNPETSTFKDKDGNQQMQDVCKIQLPDYPEALKVSLNMATINALVDAFGSSSKDWQGHILALEIDKLPGKKFPLYLIPAGYKRIEDENGYSKIVKIEAAPVKTATDNMNATLSAEASKPLKDDFSDIPF